MTEIWPDDVLCVSVSFISRALYGRDVGHWGSGAVKAQTGCLALVHPAANGWKWRGSVASDMAFKHRLVALIQAPFFL